MADIYNMPEKQMKSLIGEKDLERIKQHKSRFEPDKIWNYVTTKGIKHTYIGADDFPKRLLNIPDPPFGLFYKGRLMRDDTPAVAVIGARKCSEYGRVMAERFAMGFAANGINVISGMALGVDGISQRAALKANGSSYAVLGGGVDMVYPKANELLYIELVEKGGVISEYPPGVQPRPALFPPRNRIISALSDVVLVVEAAPKSGTVITVDMALEQGREVYAVPGRCSDELSLGCNQLLRQGANPATSPEDIIEDMGWENLKPVTDVKKTQFSGVSGEIYKVMEIMPQSQDNIIMKLRSKNINYSLTQIFQGMLELEIKGCIVRENGQYRLLNA
jgi:DNA processing protein